jgi:hypothetical protein
MELSLVESLTGNAATDASIISTLETDFTNGHALNEKNLQMVSLC